MSRVSWKKIYLVAIYGVLIMAANAQPGCPVVNIQNGNNPGFINSITLPCGTSCANLNAVPFDVGATTDYSVGQIAYNPPVAFNTGTQVLDNTDDLWSGVINLPFTFCFYGNPFTSAIIGSNGCISFNTNNAGIFNNWSIPGPAPFTSETDMFNSIMAPWQDLDPTNTGEIYYNIGGTAPCRYFEVSWNQCPMYGDPNSVNTAYCTTAYQQTQMMVIYETTNAIDVYIQQKGAACGSWNGGKAIEGIQNSTGTAAVTVPGRNATQWGPVNNDAWRFTPDGTSIVSVSWYKGNTQISTDSFVTVCPSNTTGYTARAVYLPCAGGTPVTVTDSVTVFLSGPLSAGVDSSKNVSCFGLNNGAIYAHVSGGTPPVNYGWSNGSTALTLTNLSPGTYIFTADDASSCLRTDTIVITQPAQLSATVHDSTITTCIATGGSLNVYPVGGNPSYHYSWNNGEAGSTDSLIPQGTYTVNVTDSLGCATAATGTLTVVISQDGIALTAPAIINDSCPGLADGSIAANVTGGVTPYFYAWSNAQTGDTAINLAAGPYTVTVTDGGHCTTTGTYNVTQPAPIAINPVIQNISCFDSVNGSITTNVTGGTPGYTYFWSDFSFGSSDSLLFAGPYSLTVTDTLGCSISQTYNISQPTQLTINQPAIQNIGCTGGNTGSIAAQVTQGTPGYTYTWVELPSGLIYNGQTITGLSYGSYYLTVTDANGCNDTASYFVDSILQLSYLDSVNNVSCNGGNNGAAKISVTNGTPPYTFSWDYGAPITDSIITNLSAGPVEVQITDSNNCTSQIFLNITQPAPVSINLVTVTNVLCFGGSNGSITVTATGGTPGYTYAWNNAETGPTDTGLVAGTYGVLATDTNGCTAAATYNVSQPTALTINAPNIQNIGCSGGNTGSITANVTNGTPNYTFNWLQEQGGQVYTTQTISNLAPGGYFLAVTDANGCMDTTSYNITAIPLLTFTMDSTPVSCYNGNNGSARVSITSGTPPYMFSWNDAPYGTDSSITNLRAGNLSVHVTDANNCLAVDTAIYISQPPSLNITLLSHTEVQCNGGNDGALMVTASGGTPSYSYRWNNQVVDSDNTHLTAGNYIVVVLDNNDCADTAQYIITQPTPLVANPVIKNALCYFGADGLIDVNPSGGSPLYGFRWSNGETTQVATGLVRGFYDCTISDANQCSIIVTDTVGQPQQMQIFDSATAVKCTGQQNGTAIVTATGDTPPYSYYATRDGVNFIFSTNGTILGLDTGVYTIQVSDSNGCTADTFVYVPGAIPDEFYPPVADSTLCFGPDYNDGSVLVLDSTIQNGPYQYGIDGGPLQDTGYFQNLSAGPHIVTSVNANGCIDSIPVVVPEPLPIEAIVTPDSITLPLGGSQSVLVTYLNATNPAFSWANTLGFSCSDCPNPVVSSYAPGQYVVTVSMVNGTATCYGSTTLYVNVLGHTKAFIPNVFTPNGDGVDDVFLIYGEDVKTASLKVFNRWGELVYSTTNSLAGWDGTYKGMIQMPGVFTYEAEITYLDNSQETKKGTVTLLR